MLESKVNLSTYALDLITLWLLKGSTPTVFPLPPGLYCSLELFQRIDNML